MKLFRSTSIFMNGVLFLGMMSACQKENDIPVAPESSAEITDQNARTNLAFGTLIKDGNISLTYDSQNQNRIKKETHTDCYYDFTYTPQLITAIKLKYGYPSTDCKYTLDANGRCVQTTTKSHTYIYNYNADGQLSSFYNKYYPKQEIMFTYATDVNGWKKSVSMITFHDVYGIKTKELKYSYGTAASCILDKHPLIPDVLPLEVSRYLPVFGCFNTNLPKTVREEIYLPNGQKASSTLYEYIYAMDNSGNAENITLKKTNGTVVSSTDREYFKPSFSM